VFNVQCSVFRRRRTLHAGLLLFCVLCCIELLSLGIGRYLERRGVFYRANPADDYERYLAERDPVLGWPSPGTFGKGQRDASGSRIVPAFPDPVTEPLVSIYGDSFTWGTEVDDEHAWGNVLAELVARRVSNFGVSGYGTDQSYLRFSVNTNDSARIVLLGHLSENILRNVNQFRDLLYPGEGRGFKPRFVLEPDGGLRLVPIPSFEASVYRDVVARPGRYLSHEFFAPGGKSGVAGLSFPWSLSVLACLGNPHVKAKLAGRPRYAEFYEMEHASGSLGLTAAILERFADEAKRMGKTPVVLVMPTTLDIEQVERGGDWPYTPLVGMLRGMGVDVLDIGARIVALPGKEPGELFGVIHFNEKGNRQVAEIVHSALVKRGLL